MSKDHNITDIEQLETLYGEAVPKSITKEIRYLNAEYRNFVEAAPFMAVATVGSEGLDCSPRGDDRNVVRVVDEKTIRFGDRRGNNRLDTLRNIIVNPQVGMLFLVPGRGETVRVNGRAWVSVADELRDRFTDRYRRPASVIGIEPTEVYLHCAKCIRRGGLWDPRSWADPGEGPSAGAILASHAGLDDVAAVDAGLEQSYARGLADDRPG